MSLSARRKQSPPLPVGELTSRWVALSEELVVCGRLLRSGLLCRSERWDLTAPEFSALWLCRRAPRSGGSQREMAREMAVSPAQVSGLVEQLRRKGLLEGRRAETDRRRQIWRLTIDGQATLDAVLADLDRATAELDQHWPAQQTSQLLAMLARLSQTAREELSPDQRPAHGEQAVSQNAREAA